MKSPSFSRAVLLACALTLPLAPCANSQPQIIASGATVSVPITTTESKARLRLRNGTAYLDEETGKREGNVVTARLEAEPGLYEIRARSTDKSGRYVGEPLDIVVPGLRREAGVWLFNGSIWIPKATLTSASPTYLSNLKREGKTKLPVSIATPNLLSWNAVPALVTADGVGTPSSMPIVGGPAVGTWVTARGATTNAAQLKSLGQNRTIILGVNATDPLAAQQLQTAARQSDAVALQFDAAQPFAPQLWPLKMARRMAEETADFDLPIFADVSVTKLSDAQLLEIYQSGATGFIANPGAPVPVWAKVWNDNSNWLLGAVTLEDMGVLPAPNVERLLADLRQGERIPLVGQLPNEKNPKGESVMALLGDQTTAADLDGFKKAASEGYTLYLEGLPAPALYPKIGEITGTQVAALPAPREENLTLDDVWIWGALQGVELPVTQRVALTVKKSLAAQTKEQKGMSIETQPRAAGRLTADENGWMVCPVGKGRIFWLPHALRDTNNPRLPAYYAAVAGGMQSALVSLEGDTANVRVALRATPGQTALLALFNDGDAPAKLNVSARGDATLVQDLMSGETVESQISGFQVRFELMVPARGFRWLALASTQETFDKERATKRVKGRLK